MNMNESVFGAFIMAITWLLVVVIMPITPYLTRKTECFGVSVPEAEYKNAYFEKVRRGYAVSTVVAGLILAAASVVSVLLLGESAVVWSMAPLFCYLFISFAFYYVGHKKIKAFKQTQNWEQKTIAVAEIISQKESSVKSVSPWLLLLYPLLTFITTIITIVFYDKAPDKIPMHYDFAGNVTDYAAKSFGSMMFVPIMQAFMSALFCFVYVMIAKSKKQISAENPEDSLWRTLSFRRIMNISLLVLGCLIIGMFGTMQLAMLGIINSKAIVWLPLVILAVVFGGTIYLSLKVGQGGSRLKRGSAEAHKVFVQEEDKYWKLGCFYYNPNDPSLFIEKRFGIGWTMNFARPANYIILAIFVLFLVGSIVTSFAVDK